MIFLKELVSSAHLPDALRSYHMRALGLWVEQTKNRKINIPPAMEMMFKLVHSLLALICTPVYE